jgi:hypothetical protein
VKNKMMRKRVRLAHGTKELERIGDWFMQKQLRGREKTAQQTKEADRLAGQPRTIAGGIPNSGMAASETPPCLGYLAGAAFFFFS